MPGGRIKTRITVAIDPNLAQALDARASGRKINRSVAVEEALSWWLKIMAEQDAEELGQFSDGRRKRWSEATEAKIVAQMVLEALRYQFPAMQDMSDYDLRRRVLSKLDSPNGT